MKRSIWMAAIAGAALLAQSGFALRVTPLPKGVSDYQERIFVSGPPSAEMVEAMRAMGVKEVIDLRDESEPKVREADLFRKNQINYVSAPIAKSGPLQKDQVQAVESLLEKNARKKTWLFCSSGNRAAALLAVHMVKHDQMQLDEAIAAAKKRGLTKDEMAEKVRAYLRQP